MNVALEAQDYERAVAIAKDLHPEVHPFQGCQAMYWVDYGRALARIRERHDAAVMALLRAEKISPRRVHRNPLAREVVAGLLTRLRRTHQPGGNCGGWRFGLACQCNPSRIASASADIRFLVIVHPCQP
jgi:hypothetical protein